MSNKAVIFLIFLSICLTGYYWFFENISIYNIIFFIVLIASLLSYYAFLNGINARKVAFLIILSACSGVFYFIYYFFVTNTANLSVDIGSAENVKIELKWEYSNYPWICNKKCIFEKIPPVKYAIIVKKDSYKTIIENFELKRNEKKELKFDLQKEIITEEVSSQAKEKRLNLFYKNYLDQLKTKREIVWFYKELISYSNSGSLKIFSFDWALETEIFNSNEVKIKNIWLNNIDWIIFFQTNKNENYIYDLEKNTSYFITFTDEILFAKRTQFDNKYIFETLDWVYVYNINDNSKDKKTLFDDFVILKNNKILGLIKKDSKNKLSVLNISDNNKNKIILHNIETKERKVIYEFDWEPNFLLYNLDKIYISNKNKNISEIKNLEF